MGGQNPTSRDIAEAAGVSQATVSRALRNSPLVRPETRERVHRIARELNYFVNRNAAGLRTQHSFTIALMLFDETSGESAEINPFFLSMLGHITRSAATLGYDVLISIQQLSNDWHLQYKASNRADGIILLGYGNYLQYRGKLDELETSGTPFIIWGPKTGGQPGHSLGCDNQSGGYQAASHLVSLGRKRIAFIGDASPAAPELALRFEGYRRALHEAGLEVDPALQVAATSGFEPGYAAARRLLESGAGFDALFAVTDALAIGAIQALKDAGVALPRDVAVVGFDDLPRAAYVTPALTTVRQDVQRAGELLVGNLVRLIEGKTVESTVMPTSLVVRESCGAKLAR